MHEKMHDWWKVDLKNIGREKVTHTFRIRAVTLPMAEGKALRLCKKYLASKNVWFESYGDLTYEVFAGGRSVGSVSI